MGVPDNRQVSVGWLPLVVRSSQSLSWGGSLSQHELMQDYHFLLLFDQFFFNHFLLCTCAVLLL